MHFVHRLCSSYRFATRLFSSQPKNDFVASGSLPHRSLVRSALHLCYRSSGLSPPIGSVVILLYCVAIFRRPYLPSCTVTILAPPLKRQDPGPQALRLHLCIGLVILIYLGFSTLARPFTLTHLPPQRLRWPPALPLPHHHSLPWSLKASVLDQVFSHVTVSLQQPLRSNHLFHLPLPRRRRPITQALKYQ